MSSLVELGRRRGALVLNISWGPVEYDSLLYHALYVCNILRAQASMDIYMGNVFCQVFPYEILQN